MKISRQNLQKEGYLAPKTEYCEIRQDAQILAGSSINMKSSQPFQFTVNQKSW